MKAGFHEGDITPAVGMEWPGGYGKNYIKWIRAPLKVRAAVIDDGAERVALVGIDSLAVQSDRAVRDIRRAVEERTGIPGDHILVAASHTHTGGPFFGFEPRDYADAPDLVKELLGRHTTIADPAYCEHVKKQIVTAICEADGKREEALLSVGSGVEDKVAFNRRFMMDFGRAVTHPGKGNPGILEPAGPTDPEVGVVAAWRPSGELLGCIVNFACHGTTLGDGVSPDWIGFMEKTIKGAMRRDAVTVFLNGACGDITQVDNRSPGEVEAGEKYARLVGCRVGAEAIKVLVSAQTGELVPVAAATKVLRLKRRPPGAERLAKCLAITKAGLAGGEKTTDWTFAKEIVILDYLVKKAPEIPVEVQAIQVGPAVFLANPAEYFCRLGLDIKRESPFPYTFVVELANGCVGYVPTEEAFGPTGGGYETVLTSYSNLQKEAGRLIAEAGIELASQLEPGAAPEPAKAPPPPPGADPREMVWDYGIRGPELE